MNEVKTKGNTKVKYMYINSIGYICFHINLSKVSTFFAPWFPKSLKNLFYFITSQLSQLNLSTLQSGIIRLLFRILVFDEKSINSWESTLSISKFYWFEIYYFSKVCEIVWIKNLFPCKFGNIPNFIKIKNFIISINILSEKITF